MIMPSSGSYCSTRMGSTSTVSDITSLSLFFRPLPLNFYNYIRNSSHHWGERRGYPYMCRSTHVWRSASLLMSWSCSIHCLCRCWEDIFTANNPNSLYDVWWKFLDKDSTINACTWKFGPPFWRFFSGKFSEATRETVFLYYLQVFVDVRANDSCYRYNINIYKATKQQGVRQTLCAIIDGGE